MNQPIRLEILEELAKRFSIDTSERCWSNPDTTAAKVHLAYSLYTQGMIRTQSVYALPPCTIEQFTKQLFSVGYTLDFCAIYIL